MWANQRGGPASTGTRTHMASCGMDLLSAPSRWMWWHTARCQSPCRRVMRKLQAAVTSVRRVTRAQLSSSAATTTPHASPRWSSQGARPWHRVQCLQWILARSTPRIVGTWPPEVFAMCSVRPPSSARPPSPSVRRVARTRPWACPGQPQRVHALTRPRLLLAMSRGALGGSAPRAIMGLRCCDASTTRLAWSSPNSLVASPRCLAWPWTWLSLAAWTPLIAIV
mmetsp:Transcript_100730/g.215916  ORF Transcript_100730/g.215916 Transcript_100730/m.215916 type:complete len:224 (+) Transcript_100730:1748-2419(+)